MGKSINVQMKQFNGTDYDNIFPDAKNGMATQIIVTPYNTFTSIKATGPSGQTYNGILQNGKWVIEVNEYGEYTINGTGSTSYSDTLIVDTCKIYNIYLGKKPLNDFTWQEIRAISDAGIGESYWAVGDAKQITINGNIGLGATYDNYQPWVYILGFNHNAEKEGNNRIHFGCFRSAQNYSSTNSIALDDSEYGNLIKTTGYFSMNSSLTNSGGWKSCQMRTVILNSDATSPSSAAANTFLKALPEDLKAVMKSCTKYTDNVGGGNTSASNVTATTDWVWLLSEFEIHGNRKYANSAEQNYQKQYQYYINGNSKVKYRSGSTVLKGGWQCRSLSVTSSGSFCEVGETGNTKTFSSSIPHCIAPGFCV